MDTDPHVGFASNGDLCQVGDGDAMDGILHDVEILHIGLLLEQVPNALVVYFIERQQYLCFSAWLFVNLPEHVLDRPPDQPLPRSPKHSISLSCPSHPINKDSRVVPLQHIINGHQHGIPENSLIITLLHEDLLVLVHFIRLAEGAVRGQDLYFGARVGFQDGLAWLSLGGGLNSQVDLEVLLADGSGGARSGFLHLDVRVIYEFIQQSDLGGRGKRQQQSMGNNSHNKTNEQFIKAVETMKRRNNDYPVQKLSTHLEQKYRNLIFQSLTKSQLSKNIKNMLFDVIENKIKKQDLTAALTVLNSLKDNNVDQILKASVTSSRIKGESKNVVIKFDTEPKRNIRKFTGSKIISGSYIPQRYQDTLEGRIKTTGSFICRQLSKNYHPFRFMCKKFAQILGFYLENAKQSTTEQQYQKKQGQLHKTIKQFCLFLVAGCLGIYKKWVIEYTGIQEKKYEKWVYGLVLNEIWAVNDSYLLKIVYLIIEKEMVPVNIDAEALGQASSQGLLQPRDFGIDEQLQLSGNYFTAIFEMSSLVEKKQPREILRSLETIKNRICYDIDEYHKLFETGQIYEVNGDNIMGIVAFLLSRVALNIRKIAVLLLFLKLLYGEGVFYNMDVSSYMYSTIWGALEYLEGMGLGQQKKQSSRQDQGEEEQQEGTESTITGTNEQPCHQDI